MGKVTKSDTLKNNLIKALEKSLGVVTDACKDCNCSRQTFYKYYNTDNDFKNKVDAVSEVALDFVESQLYKQIREGNTAATIFYLKTKARKRGYIERMELDQNQKQIIEFKNVSKQFPDE
jgi:hypothetical protein